MNFSFAGCGFLGIYHVGVSSCLRAHAPNLLGNAKISGASAGAIAATCLLTGCSLGDCTSYVLRIATKARSRALGPLHPSFNIIKIIRDGLNEILPHNAHLIVNGRLFVSMTRVSDRKNIVVSQFESKADLIQALLCSAFVPFYCGLVPPTYKGVYCVDGCLSDNLPSLDDNTILVSPFAGESDICPSDQSANFLHIHLANTSIQCSSMNLYRMSRVLFPPHPEILSEMCKQGFDDTLRYLQNNDLISCVRHISVKSTLMPNEEETSDYDSSDEADGVISSNHCGDISHSGDCIECKRRRQMALRDTIPPVVADVLQSTIDSVSNGIWAWVYYSKVFHAFSLLATPLILPLELTLLYGDRFLQWIPYVPNDLKWSLENFLFILKQIIAYINHKRHKYSARLTCQLDITDSDYGHHKTEVQTAFTSWSTLRHYDITKLKPGDDIQILSRGPSRSSSPLTCLHDIRQHILEEEVFQALEVHTRRDSMDMSAEIIKPHSSRTANSTSWSTEVVDSFEHTLDAANKMDAVLSYHYMEDGKNMFTEIFTVKSEEQKPVWPSTKALAQGGRGTPVIQINDSVVSQEEPHIHINDSAISLSPKSSPDCQANMEGLSWDGEEDDELCAIDNIRTSLESGAHDDAT